MDSANELAVSAVDSAPSPRSQSNVGAGKTGNESCHVGAGQPAPAHKSSASQPLFQSRTSQLMLLTQPSSSGRLMASTGRRLQIVLVIDKKTSKHLRIREMACSDIQSVTSSLNVNLQLIDFERLDFAEAKSLDAFYNADIALVDFTITHQQPSLCYHVGVRESMGQTYNIITMYFPEEAANQQPNSAPDMRIMETLKKTLSHLHLITYFLSKEDATVLLSADKFSKVDRLRELEEQLADSGRYQKGRLKKGRSVVTFAERIRIALNNVSIDADAHAREKFLSDLRKVREIEEVEEVDRFLARMRSRLDNTDVLSVDTVHQYLLCLRDTQNYDAMISLIEELERIDQKQIVTAQAVRYIYAFALNRRNKEGDRDKALQAVHEIMEHCPTNASPDVICLAGRVYKDMFIASDYQDREALDNAIDWYRRAFNLSPCRHDVATLFHAEQPLNNQVKHRPPHHPSPPLDAAASSPPRRVRR